MPNALAWVTSSTTSNGAPFITYPGGTVSVIPAFTGLYSKETDRTNGTGHMAGKIGVWCFMKAGKKH